MAAIASGRSFFFSGSFFFYFIGLAALALLLLAPGALRAQGTIVGDVPGDDWSLPAWAEALSARFYSESADPARHVDLRVADFTWRQLKPTATTFSTTAVDSVYGMDFASWSSQLAGSDSYWLRLWMSGVEWAPAWVQAECGVSAAGTGYEGDDHLPLWNACLWSRARELYREVLLTRGLRSDPRLAFVYVPGGFTWCEFDYEIPSQAAASGALDFAPFDAWFDTMVADLVAVMNGENADPADDYAWKLVFTGEDYPFGPESWGTQDDLQARDAVAAGMGIRTGITEVFNFHLDQVPAYGTTIAPDGYLATDESWPALFDGRTVATENECYNDCGFTTADPYYAVKMSNLRALQLRMNRIYVVPEASYLDAYPAHWEWVRRSLGQSVYTSADAWAALREAEDTYWLDDSSFTWSGAPWVKNWERWLTQRDLGPDATSRRGTEAKTNVLDPSNGTAYEGRRTQRAAGQDRMLLFVDDRFVPPGMPTALDLQVSYKDSAGGGFRVDYAVAAGVASSAEVTPGGSGTWRTATFRIDDALWNGSVGGGADLALVALGAGDLEARFVRLIKRAPAAVFFVDGFESGTTAFWSRRSP